MSGETEERVSKRSELRLSRWLRRELGLLGALDLVREYGAHRVVDVMHEHLLEWSPMQNRWAPPARFDNPGGFLRWALRQQ